MIRRSMMMIFYCVASRESKSSTSEQAGRYRPMSLAFRGDGADGEVSVYVRGPNHRRSGLGRTCDVQLGPDNRGTVSLNWMFSGQNSGGPKSCSPRDHSSFKWQNEESRKDSLLTRLAWVKLILPDASILRKPGV